MSEEYFSHVNKYGLEHTTLDRINNDGNYCRDNCRRANRKTQATNRSNGIILNNDGKKQSINNRSKELGINESTLRNRIYRGQTVERALSKQN